MSADASVSELLCCVHLIIRFSLTLPFFWDASSCAGPNPDFSSLDQRLKVRSDILNINFKIIVRYKKAQTENEFIHVVAVLLVNVKFHVSK